MSPPARQGKDRELFLAWSKLSKSLPSTFPFPDKNFLIQFPCFIILFPLCTIFSGVTLAGTYPKLRKLNQKAENWTLVQRFYLKGFIDLFCISSYILLLSFLYHIDV